MSTVHFNGNLTRFWLLFLLISSLILFQSLILISQEDSESGSLVSDAVGEICGLPTPVDFSTVFRRADQLYLSPGNAWVEDRFSVTAGTTVSIQTFGYAPPDQPETFQVDYGIRIMGVSREDGFPVQRPLAGSNSETTLIYTFEEDDQFGIYVLSDVGRDAGKQLTVVVGCGEEPLDLSQVTLPATFTPTPTFTPTVTPEFGLDDFDGRELALFYQPRLQLSPDDVAPDGTPARIEAVYYRVYELPNINRVRIAYLYKWNYSALGLITVPDLPVDLSSLIQPVGYNPAMVAVDFNQEYIDYRYDIGGWDAGVTRIPDLFVNPHTHTFLPCYTFPGDCTDPQPLDESLFVELTPELVEGIEAELQDYPSYSNQPYNLDLLYDDTYNINFSFMGQFSGSFRPVVSLLQETAYSTITDQDYQRAVQLVELEFIAGETGRGRDFRSILYDYEQQLISQNTDYGLMRDAIMNCGYGTFDEYVELKCFSNFLNTRQRPPLRESLPVPEPPEFTVPGEGTMVLNITPVPTATPAVQIRRLLDGDELPIGETVAVSGSGFPFLTLNTPAAGRYTFVVLSRLEGHVFLYVNGETANYISMEMRERPGQEDVASNSQLVYYVFLYEFPQGAIPIAFDTMGINITVFEGDVFDQDVEALMTEVISGQSTSTASEATPPPTAVSTPAAPAVPTPQQSSSRIARNSDWTPITQVIDGVEMVLVPAGCFKEDRPAQTVPEYETCIDNAYWIDRTEASYEQLVPYLPQMLYLYYPTVDGSVDNLSAEQEQQVLRLLEPDFKDSRSGAILNLPPKTVNWEMARAFCELRGSRLPTTIEWEYAARGPEKLLFPWGNQQNTDLWASGSSHRGLTVPVDSFPEGASWVGALNMMGNVSEYTSTLYAPLDFGYPYDAADGREDLDTIGSRIVRGTSVSRPGGDLRTQTSLTQDTRIINIDEHVGFRCVRDYDESEIIAQPTETNVPSEADVEGFEAVEINSSDQRALTVYIPEGWRQEVPRISGPTINTSRPEGGLFDFYPPIMEHVQGQSPELHYRIVPYTKYEDVCIALSRLNTNIRRGARNSFSGSVCDTMDEEPTTQVFGGNEWLLIRYEPQVIEESPSHMIDTLAVTVGKGLVIEVALISTREEHDELLETVLYPALAAFSFDDVEGEGVVGLPPTPLPYGPGCPPSGKPTRLFVGGQGRPVSLINKPIFDAPDSSYTVFNRIAWVEGVFDVLEGPVCVNGTAFYRIENKGLTGWIRETSSVPGSPADYDFDRVDEVVAASAATPQPRRILDGETLPFGETVSVRSSDRPMIMLNTPSAGRYTVIVQAPRDTHVGPFANSGRSDYISTDIRDAADNQFEYHIFLYEFPQAEFGISFFAHAINVTVFEGDVFDRDVETLLQTAQVSGGTTTTQATPPGGSAATLTPAPTQSAPVPTITPTPAGAAVTGGQCPGALPHRMVVGQRGRVTAGAGNRMRTRPTTSGEFILTIQGNREFVVLDGPVCANNYSWWQVDFNGRVGWTVEADNEDYWLEPIIVLSNDEPQEIAGNSLSPSGIFAVGLPAGWSLAEAITGEMSISAANVNNLFVGFLAPFTLYRSGLDPFSTMDELFAGTLAGNGGSAVGAPQPFESPIGAATRQDYTVSGQNGILIAIETEEDGLLLFYAQSSAATLANAEPTLLNIVLSLDYDSATARAAASEITCSIRSSNNANLRGGPGTNFDTVGQLIANVEAAVDGQTQGADGFTWWRLADGTGWAREDVVGEIGECARVPIVEPE